MWLYFFIKCTLTECAFSVLKTIQNTHHSLLLDDDYYNLLTIIKNSFSIIVSMLGLVIVNTSLIKYTVNFESNKVCLILQLANSTATDINSLIYVALLSLLHCLKKVPTFKLSVTL